MKLSDPTYCCKQKETDEGKWDAYCCKPKDHKGNHSYRSYGWWLNQERLEETKEEHPIADFPNTKRYGIAFRIDLDMVDSYSREQFLQYVHTCTAKAALDLAATIIKEYDERHKK